MTEDQIECRVSRKVDALDARFMAGKMTQEEYDAAQKAISEWADKEYAFLAATKRVA